MTTRRHILLHKHIHPTCWLYWLGGNFGVETSCCCHSRCHDSLSPHGNPDLESPGRMDSSPGDKIYATVQLGWFLLQQRENIFLTHFQQGKDLLKLHCIETSLQVRGSTQF